MEPTVRAYQVVQHQYVQSNRMVAAHIHQPLQITPYTCAYKIQISICKWPIEQMSIFKIGKAETKPLQATAEVDYAREKNGRKKINHP